MVSKYSGFEVQSQQLGSSFGLAFGRVDGWQHIMSGMHAERSRDGHISGRKEISGL